MRHIGIAVVVAVMGWTVSGCGEDEKQTAGSDDTCEGGDMTACFSLGVRYSDGEGVPKDHEKANALYQKACDGGHIKGCFNLAIQHKNGEGVPKDQAKAKTDWESAEKQAKEAEEKAKTILADASKPQPEKDAAQKGSKDKRKRANDLKLALDKITAERIKPNEQKKADAEKTLVSSEQAAKEAEQNQLDT